MINQFHLHDVNNPFEGSIFWQAMKKANVIARRQEKTMTKAEKLSLAHKNDQYLAPSFETLARDLQYDMVWKAICMDSAIEAVLAILKSPPHAY